PAAPAAPAEPTPKRPTRQSKAAAKKAGDKVTTSNLWTIEECDRLIRHIVDSDDNFRRAEKKGANTKFWQQVAETLFENKRSADAVQLRWKELKLTFQQVKAFESFTGGDGDGDWKIDDDDDKETILDKLRGRLDGIRSKKPNIDPHSKVKSAEVYWDWIRGGDDSWYAQLYMRFRDMSTFERKFPRRSGTLSPAEDSSDSNDDTTSKSDATPMKRSNKLKTRVIKSEKKTRGMSDMGIVAGAAKDFFATQLSANEARTAMAQKRLDLEFKKTNVANKVTEETLKMQCESQKRKWSNDKRMAAIAEEDAKRRQTQEEKTANSELKLAQVRELNKLMADPMTDESVKDIYREQIKLVLGGL
ncbi:hypothetical protein FRC07_006332, partial [Ceratobasidium sp. 392]